MHRILLRSMGAVLALLPLGAGAQLRASDRPQDTYAITRLFGYPASAGRSLPETGTNAGYLLQDGRLAVELTSPQEIRVYAADGSVSTSFACSGSSDRQRMLELADSRIVTACNLAGLKLRDAQFNELGTIAAAGTGVGQVRAAHCLAAANDGVLFVSEALRRKVLVFNSDLTFRSEWGDTGTELGRFNSTFCARPLPDGDLLVADNTPEAKPRISVYSAAGVFKRLVTTNLPGSTSGENAGPARSFALIGDRFTFQGNSLTNIFATPPYFTYLHLYDLNATLVGGIPVPGIYSGISRVVRTSSDGALVTNLLAPPYLYFGVLRPRFRTLIGHGAGVPPQPTVLQVRPRPGTTLTEISFRVDDPDSAVVEVHALAFREGIESLANVVRVADISEGAVGSGIPTGSVRSFVWNASTDLGQSTGFSSLRVAVLANDARPQLIELSFVRLPPSGGDPELVISPVPLTDADLLEAWFWLVASGDGAISLTGGELRGTAGVYSGQTLASGTTTTELGRLFLFERMMIREATPAEVLRAKTGTTAGIQQFTPPSRAGDRPLAINELGIDTGATTGYWVVPVM